MKNDFFKYILLSSGSKQNRTELETETLPYTFNSNSYKLRNYRIYGNTVNGESVGNLVTEGEHAGEYCIPVTIEGKNLLQNMGTSQTINGVTFTVNSDKSITCKGTATATISYYIHENTIIESGSYKLTGCPTGGAASNFFKFDIISGGTWLAVDTGNGASFNIQEPVQAAYRIVIYSGYTCNDLTFYPMIRKADITDNTYEPHHDSITTNIFLPEQINNETEYIDFREQKQYFAGGTSENVSLPAIPTIDGTNIISVGTTVQPSKIYLQGNISEIETVSARTVQANIQSLQPLSLDNEDLQLDVMPSDDLQLDVIIPTANLNRIEDDEDAE